MITISVIVEEGGCETVKISTEMIGKLAESIKNQGYEWVTLISKTIKVVGFIVTGTQTGDRIIVLGKQEKESVSNEKS